MPAMIGIIPNEVLNNAVKIPMLGAGSLMFSVSLYFHQWTKSKIQHTEN